MDYTYVQLEVIRELNNRGYMPRYAGYDNLVVALTLLLTDDSYKVANITPVYREVGRLSNITYHTVERNIRSMIKKNGEPNTTANVIASLYYLLRGRLSKSVERSDN